MNPQQEIFEQNLKERFKNRWKKTNYWFAIPNKKEIEVIDANLLYPSDDHFSTRWIRQLLDSDIASTTLKPDSSIISRLRDFFFENRKNPEKKFGFGYPTLIMKDTSGQRPFIAAPLFIWEVDFNILESNNFELVRKKDFVVTPNELVIQHLESLGLDLRNSFESAIEKDTMNSVHLQRICNEISIKFDFNTSINTLSLKTFPIYNDLNKISEGNGQIIWSGVLGLFEFLPNRFLQKINIAKQDKTQDDTEQEIVENTDSIPKVQDFRNHYFSGIQLNPYQSNVLRTLETENRIAVKATNYTGLNDLVLGLITNTLSNGGKTLVVSKHTEVLQRVQDLVNTHYEVGHLAVKLADFSTEKEIFYNLLREIAEGAKRHVPINEEEYQVALNTGKRLQARLDEMHDALNKPLFKGKKWIELIGDFLKTHQSEGRQFLNSQLLATDYTFTNESYEILKNIVLKGKDLYKEVNTLRHPLEVLHHDIFINNELATAKENTTQQIAFHANKITELYHDFVLKIEEYGQALQSLYESHHNDLSEKADEIANEIANNQQRFGKNFNSNSTWTNFKLRLFSLFSKRSKNILETKKKVLQSYDDLKNTFYNKRYFEYSFLDAKNGLAFSKINENITDLKASLRNWKNDFPVIIHNEIQRLSAQTVHPDLEFKSDIEALNQKFINAIQALNNDNLFLTPYEAGENFVINNKLFLEKVMDQTESLNFNMRDFDAYFEWKKFWLGLTEANQKLLKAFITSKPDNWEKALDSWFLHHVLTQHETEAIPNSDLPLNQYFANHEVLLEHINTKTKNYWTHRRGAALRALKNQDKVGFNTYFTKRSAATMDILPFKKMFEKYQNTIQALVPVICTTPTIAQNYFKEHDFEQVIVLEADNLAVEVGFPLLNFGNQSVIIGSGQLNRLGKSDTLMAFALDNYPKRELLFETTDKQLYADFINRAFHKHRLQKGITANNESFLLDLNYIEGSFDDKDLTNEIEAKEIIKILRNLYPENNRYLPKVGIVCFTKAQRDLLSQQLTDLRKHKVQGHQAIAHFLRNGLTVCALEDIVGKQFDITIVGTTFSRNSNIEAAFNFLRGEYGEYLMYNLFTSSKKALLICSSLTHDFIEENKFTFTNNGLHLLSNLMDFIHCNKTQNMDRVASILAGLYATFNEVKYPEQMMISELRNHLQKHFLEDRIKDSIYDLAKIDFWIKNIYANQRPKAIILDSYFWRFPKGDYIWDKELRNLVIAEGYDYQTVWSVNWWKYPEKTPIQFVKSVQKQDTAFAPEILESETALDIESDLESDSVIAEVEENIDVLDSEEQEIKLESNSVTIEDIIEEASIDDSDSEEIQ